MAIRNFTRLAQAMAVSLAVLSLGSLAPVRAQQRAIRSGVDVVPLAVTVTDGAGKHITGLTGGDFAVFEDGVEQPLTFFASGDVPLDVALVIDASASMRADLPLVQKAACGLVRKLGAADRGAVVELKDAVSIPQPLTTDHRQIEAALGALVATGSTALYDGLYVMLKELERARGGSTEVRRQVIVLFSDGLDNTSHLPFEAVIELARRAAVSIYVIALRGEVARLPRSAQTGLALEAEYAMRTIAREAGGRAFFPRTAVELPGIYGAIAQELASQYDLAYVPVKPGGDGAFRRVFVRLAPRTNALARTRTGYYANRGPGSMSHHASRTGGDLR
jgi:VWFA-related protein